MMLDHHRETLFTNHFRSIFILDSCLRLYIDYRVLDVIDSLTFDDVNFTKEKMFSFCFFVYLVKTQSPV